MGVAVVWVAMVGACERTGCASEQGGAGEGSAATEADQAPSPATEGEETPSALREAVAHDAWPAED
ncbi:MAG: hypothetical protein ACOC9T_03915, partial [Myxococcota bacterium]